MKQMRTFLIAGLSATLLSACSTLMEDTNPPASDTSQIKANATEETSRELYLDVVNGLRMQGKHRAVLAYLDDYDLRYPGDDRSAILRAEALIALGEGEKAVPVLKRLSNGDLKGRAYSGMGKVWAQRGNWNKAAATFEIALKTDPTDSTMLNNLGYAYLQTGEYGKALGYLKQALELDEGNKSVRNNLILAYYLTGDHKTARQIIERLPTDDRKKVIALLRSYEGKEK